MAHEVTNTLRSSTIIRVVDPGTTTISLANLEFNANETVNSVNIKRINWSTNGSIQIPRNSVPILSLYGNGEEDGDMWVEYFMNGKVQTEKAVITYADFDPKKLMKVTR